MARSRLGPVDVLVLSVWCGLAAGLLEVGTRVLCRAIDPTKRLYQLSRHFIWLTPLANLLVFFVLGLFLGPFDAALAPDRWLAESSAPLPSPSGRRCSSHSLKFSTAFVPPGDRHRVCVGSAVRPEARGHRRRLLMTFPGLREWC